MEDLLVTILWRKRLQLEVTVLYKIQFSSAVRNINSYGLDVSCRGFPLVLNLRSGLCKEVGLSPLL